MVIYYYEYDYGNYDAGVVIGFSTQEEAEKHSLKNHPKAKLEYSLLKKGEIWDIYTGE